MIYLSVGTSTSSYWELRVPCPACNAPVQIACSTWRGDDKAAFICRDRDGTARRARRERTVKRRKAAKAQEAERRRNQQIPDVLAGICRIPPH